MRFLHTSDWHVGKNLRNQNRDNEHSAALAEVLDVAVREKVDCVLVAGDLFETFVPSPDSERIVYDFFRELRGAAIPAVIIAGNHDHHRRLKAPARLLELFDIHVRADTVRPDEGGIVKVFSKNGEESAQIAVLPWVSERKAREWESLTREGDDIYRNYAEDVARRIEELASCYRPGAIHILLAHVMMDGAIVREGGGERALHITDVYAVKPQRLPANAHYIALGHLHRSQAIIEGRAYYSGSLIQLDFGETGQKKSVRLIEATPQRPVTIREVPITSGRQLRNIGSAKQGVTLGDIRALAGDVGDAYLKVFVNIERPLPALAEQVRELLPNAVDLVVQRLDERPKADTDHLKTLSPQELFSAYYQQEHSDVDRMNELMPLFRRLHEEVTSAPD